MQETFRRGLVTIIGSGASVPFGLPTMRALCDHLIAEIPVDSDSLVGDDAEAWGIVRSVLVETGEIEEAFKSVDLSATLDAIVTNKVASYVRSAESSAIDGILVSQDRTALGRLFRHVLTNNTVADVITTNYDRLVEVCAAKEGIRVDTMFCGHTIGRLDARASKEELLRAVPGTVGKGTVKLQHHPHIRLAKPHGSLDWYSTGEGTIRSEHLLSTAELIIAPGGSKYRKGYDVPFDAQRARANDAIDGATAFLTIGYGFNDVHLQTHLQRQFSGVPAVVLARTLTPSALNYLAANSAAVGIECGADGSGSRVTIGTSTIHLDVAIWEIDVLLKEVLRA
ncbi:SIR2 family protein [Cryobacterium sp. SO2]|uniref:SIR2 family protein n=1 Tax=Cryobacterium sp. SO2 TaxID=1897060 RepID=UPI00223E5E57|nr:SIR2 family protein [Cryobacterium sp. SO2]WEO77055.1 SIR2 family protein [Cryobacterium sp. SO2]